MQLREATILISSCFTTVYWSQNYANYNYVLLAYGNIASLIIHAFPSLKIPNAHLLFSLLQKRVTFVQNAYENENILLLFQNMIAKFAVILWIFCQCLQNYLYQLGTKGS